MEVLILDDKQLRDLIYMVYSDEIGALDTIDFKNGDEAAKLRDDCYFNYQTVEDLLADCAKLVNMFNKDDVRAHIARGISSYLVCCANNAFMTLRNYNVRKTYLEKIRDHADSLIAELKEVNPSSAIDVEHLNKRVEMYNKTITEYIRIYQSGTSDEYSKWLKDQGWTFDELLDVYKAQLGFDGPFEDLEEEKKLTVYELIIEASGRGKATFNKSLLRKTQEKPSLRTHDSSLLMISSASLVLDGDKGSSSRIEFKDVKGTAVLIYQAGSAVWNIYSADRKVEQGVREAVKYASGKAGNAIGEIIAAAIETELLVAVEASALFISAVGLVTGFAAGFIIAAVAGEILDLIFNKGGKVSIPYEHHCYVLDMPNGLDLARQIAYRK